MNQLNKELGTTVIITTHCIEEVRKADKVLTMYNLAFSYTLPVLVPGTLDWIYAVWMFNSRGFTQSVVIQSFLDIP